MRDQVLASGRTEGTVQPDRPDEPQDRQPNDSMPNAVWFADTQRLDDILRWSTPTTVSFPRGFSSMNHVLRASDSAIKRDYPRIHHPSRDQSSSNSWLINGYPATITIWTAEEWAKLIERPLDAQPYPNGIWCALRID